MKLFNLLTTDPHINLSSEYYLLTDKKFKDDDIIIFWQNKNSLIIGKNQCLAVEINQMFAKEINAHIARRFTGGGAVYQDDGNICFTFIKRNKKNEFNFKNSLKDIIEFLNSINIDAQFSGRNDITVENKKVSGNAVYFYLNDYMIHGTLLFDVDIEKMVKLLTVDKSKLSSKGIESVKSRVLNLKQIYKNNLNNFKNDFINFFEKKYNCKTINLDLSEDKNVLKINNDRFDNHTWIYGRDFDFNFSNKIKTEKGLLFLKLKTQNNKIVDLEIYSDSLLALDLKEIQKVFIGQNYDIETIKKIASSINLDAILENLSLDELTSLFFNNF